MIKLFLTVAPSIMLSSSQSDYVSVAVGMNFSLIASIIRFNLPLTSITWTHNGSSIVNRVNIAQISSLDQSSVTNYLQRTSVIPLDAGNYVMTASNPVGSATFTFSVTVTCKLVELE